MRLAWKDQYGGKMYELPKIDSRNNLFADNSDYATRFFREIQGLALVHIYRIKGNKVRRIASRGY